MSNGTLARRYNSVIRTGNGKEVCFNLSLVAISCDVNNPKLIHLLDMIQPRKSALGRRKIDSFCDGIMVLLMKPNQNFAAMFKSHFSIRTPTSIHLSFSSEIKGENHLFSSSKDAVEDNPSEGCTKCLF